MTMKLRNRLIALVCLIIFLTLGFLLFLSTSPRKPFAVILFVADNINPSSLGAARLYSGGGDARLQLEAFPNTALCRNAANDFSVPDQASASTQIAGGRRVNRNALCVDESGAKLTSLLEEAAATGRSTGLVTSGSLAGPTAAAYYAKSLNAENAPDLALQFSSHAPFDFVAGGGAGDFETQEKKGDKEAKEATAKESPLAAQNGRDGMATLHTLNEIESHPFWKKTPRLGLLSPGPLHETWGGQDSETSTLSDLVRVAIKNLQTNRRGYLLVVDDPSIAAAASGNKGEAMLRRILSFDQAVSTARHYAGDKALIVVTGRMNIGGLQLNGYPFLHDKGVAILALNNQGYPSICWSTGPGYSIEASGEMLQKKKSASASVGILSQPSAYKLPNAVGTAGDVLAFGAGQGSEQIHGFLNLTDLNRIIRESL